MPTLTSMRAIAMMIQSGCIISSTGCMTRPSGALFRGIWPHGLDNISSISRNNLITKDEHTVLAQNRYLYVRNNPVMAIDSTGHFINFIIGALVGAVIAAIEYYVEVKLHMRRYNWRTFTVKVSIAATLGAMSGGLAGIGRVTRLLHKAKFSANLIKKVKRYLTTRNFIINSAAGHYGKKHGWAYEARILIRKMGLRL